MPLPVVNLVSMPPRTQRYFDWLVTGLGMLQEEGKLTLRYGGRIWDKALRMHPKVMGAAWGISSELVDFLSPVDYTCLTGTVEKGGKVTSFALDMGDAPFNYALGLLESADLYFKCQCPVSFEREGYPLNRHIRIPYHPEVFTLQYKIRPAMLGRPLTGSTNLRKNLRVLRELEAPANPKKDIRLFASFSRQGALAARTRKSPLPAPHNYGNEGALLARWAGRIHHPNLKRDHVVEILRGMGKSDIDARIWNSDNPAIAGKMLSPEEYMQTLQRSVLNVNISGFRRSIPYRVMDTLLAGGAVATDTLAIRWYREFDKEAEVREFADLGYELDNEVDWKGVEQKLSELYEWAGQHKDNGRHVQDLYRQKWAPQVFASYVLDECIKVMETND